MLLPLVGASTSGELLLSALTRGDEAASVPADEVVRRLGLAAPVVLCLPAELLSAKPSEALTAVLLQTECVVGPFSFDQTDGARAWLEAGARFALFTQPPVVAGEDLATTVRSAAAAAALPGERLILLLETPAALDESSVAKLAKRAESLASRAGSGCYECCKPETVGVVSGVVVCPPAGSSARQEEELLGALAPLASRDRLQVFLGGLSTLTAATIGHMHHMGLHCVSTATLSPSVHAVAAPPPPPLPAAAAPISALFDEPPLPFGACIAACVRTDRSDGLFPTLVQEADGAALGLVYSSAASIDAAVRCGRGVYWSRSRQSLWRKGDTSGAWQTLLKIRLDCDADALCFTVTQHGVPPAFCHKSSLSCWNTQGGLNGLQLTLQQRLHSAPPGSYTKRLFDDPTLLRNKLVEEAQELAEAETPDHVAAEAADVFYFAMTRCVAAGVTLKMINDHLDRRTLKLQRRPGNAKKERIDAAAAILSKDAPAKPTSGDATGAPRSPSWLLPAVMAAAAVAIAGARAVAKAR